MEKKEINIPSRLIKSFLLAGLTSVLCLFIVHFFSKIEQGSTDYRELAKEYYVKCPFNSAPKHHIANYSSKWHVYDTKYYGIHKSDVENINFRFSSAMKSCFDGHTFFLLFLTTVITIIFFNMNKYKIKIS